MLKPSSRFVFLATTLATLLMASSHSKSVGDEPFRDPLTGKTASTKRAGRPSRPALLKVTLREDKGDFLLSIHLDVP